jgi:hypothetical protein
VSFVKFNVSVYTEVTCEADPEDEWSRASTSGSVTVNGATLVEKDGYDCLGVAADLKPGDTIWLVWAQYETGDSFGRDGGQYELLEVQPTYERAIERQKHYASVSDYSVPWNGYFESLDGIYVEEFVLPPSTPKQGEGEPPVG